jgi:CheY-like chemotaxis protein
MPKTLLLADDSVTIQKVVGISFANEDVQLITVDNGDDALARARETRPDLILADVVMPGKNGYEVCEAIKADAELSHIPVLLLTGTFEAFDEERAQRCGAAGHVAKPFEAQMLVDQVNRLLAQPAPAPQPTPAAAKAPQQPTPAAAPQQPAPAAAAPQAPAATPPAAEATTTPGSQSFDFFDDDLGALTPPNPVDPDATNDVDIPPAADDAFAFGSDDLAPAGAQPAPVPPAAAARADHTVAILPDEMPGADLGNPDAAGSIDDLGSTPSGRPDPFEFELDTRPGTSATQQVPTRDDANDLAEATVLDPKGASGFDVSSSDLGDSFSIGAGSESPGAGLDSAWAPPGEGLAQADSVGTSPSTAEETIMDPSFAMPSPAPPDPGPSPAASAPAAASATGGPTGPDATTQATLADIAPRLREQLHDTLEKIAWESFSDVAERVVRMAVERVERVAWEVIPHMAETLIREEIRRMKGESDKSGE